VDNPAHYGLWGGGGGRECVGLQLLAVIVTLSGEHSAEVWPVGSLGSSSAKGANRFLLRVTC
jgi:hypothetical protein